MTATGQVTQGDRRSDIINAMLHLAFEVGPDAVSTSLIAKSLGVSQPALYKHFRNKDAIWLAASARLSERIAANVRDCIASPHPPDRRMRDLILRHLAFIQEVPALPDIMVMRHASPSHQIIRQRLQSEMAQLREVMVDLIRQAQDRAMLRPDIAANDIAVLILGVVQSLVLRMIVSRDPSSLGSEGARLFDLQISTLAPRAPIS